MKQIELNGILSRETGGFVVRAQGMPHLAKLPGVVCENPTEPEKKQVFAKYFKRKRIYTDRQYKQAVQEVLVGTDVVVLGMNGYSSLSPEQCLAWGVREGAYEAACKGILKSLFGTLTSTFDGIDIRFADGASNVGVDRALLEVARDLNRPHLGHSCPKFMFYVEDDNNPVFVAKTKERYAEAFIDSLHILVAANGRAQAFRHDIMAVFEKLKYLIPVNVLRSISTNGGPPATNAKGGIEDAVAAFEGCIHMANRMLFGIDPYRDVVNHVCQTGTALVRSLLSPERAFGDVLPTFRGSLSS